MFGIRNIWRFAALLMFGAVVAPVTAAPTQSTSIQASPPVVVRVSPTLNNATFTVRTAVPTRVTLNFGTDRVNMVSISSRILRHSTTLKLSHVAPYTRYFWVVKTLNKRGAVLLRRGQFTTSKMNRAVMSVNGNRALLNGVKTFPIMAKAFGECPTAQVVASNVSIGVQYMHHQSGPGKGYGCSDEERVVRWLNADELHNLLGGSLGWIQDGPRTAPGQPEPPSWDSLPELVNLQARLAFDTEDAALISCQEGWGSATTLFERVRREASKRPLIHKVLLVRTIVRGVPSCLTAKKVPAMFWLPVLAGAAGIHYQTQSGALPSHGFDVDAGVRMAAAREAQRLATLYPVLFGGKTQRSSSNNEAVKVVAKSWGGSLYIFALNTSNQTVRATITSPVKGKARVRWENRSIIAQGGINDRFKPHELHIYSLGG